jgi:hypothetical protein
MDVGGPVLMIPRRVKGLCFDSFKLSGQAAGCGLSPAPGCRVPALDVCGPVLMIPHRVKGLCFDSFKLSGQAAGCGLSPAPGCRIPALDLGPNK